MRAALMPAPAPPAGPLPGLVYRLAYRLLLLAQLAAALECFYCKEPSECPGCQGGLRVRVSFRKLDHVQGRTSRALTSSSPISYSRNYSASHNYRSSSSVFQCGKCFYGYGQYCMYRMYHDYTK